jgi:hypothetical protein
MFGVRPGVVHTFVHAFVYTFICSVVLLRPTAAYPYEAPSGTPCSAPTQFPAERFRLSGNPFDLDSTAFAFIPDTSAGTTASYTVCPLVSEGGNVLNDMPGVISKTALTIYKYETVFCPIQGFPLEFYVFFNYDHPENTVCWTVNTTLSYRRMCYVPKPSRLVTLTSRSRHAYCALVPNPTDTQNVHHMLRSKTIPCLVASNRISLT